MKNSMSSEIYESVKMGRLIKTREKKTQCFYRQNYVFEARAGANVSRNADKKMVSTTAIS